MTKNIPIGINDAPNKTSGKAHIEAVAPSSGPGSNIPMTAGIAPRIMSETPTVSLSFFVGILYIIHPPAIILIASSRSPRRHADNAPISSLLNFDGSIDTGVGSSVSPKM